MKTVSEIFFEHKEYMASGFFEEMNKPLFNRVVRALSRHLEHSGVLELEDSVLYPSGKNDVWRIDGQRVFFNYSFGIQQNTDSLRELSESCGCGEEKVLFNQAVSDLAAYSANPLSNRFAIGGKGYTHSIINYERILKDGLEGYKKRIKKKLEESWDKLFYKALLVLIDSIIEWHSKCIESLEKINKKKKDNKLKRLIGALKNVPLMPASNFYEALLCVNFMFYIDSCDSIGGFDKFMLEFYENDSLNDDTVIDLLKEFFHNVDANDGWHMVLGGKDSYTHFTSLCLKAMRNVRRPNCGLKVNENMPDDIWDDAMDALCSGCGNPALYNEDMYLSCAPELTACKEEDLHKFAFGGCTELMFEGMSNVGSIDGGVNTLLVFEECLKKQLDKAETFDEFMALYKSDLLCNIETLLKEINLNQEYKSLYKPHPIRTLFVDDCIESGKEYNSGGARYNGSVVNFAALSNATNSLYSIKALFDGSLSVGKAALKDALEKNFEGYEKLLKELRKLCKFGNNQHEVDSIAKDITDFVFENVLKHKCWRGNGFFLPSCIMFVTYTEVGKKVGATPDGRLAFSPVADSVGPMQGTDREGPTSMLSSAACLPQSKGLGTLVLNLRLDKKMFEDKATRKKIKELVTSYFKMGGMQLQINVVDSKVLKAAVECPEKHENLIVRVGGYSEYFNRLSDQLKQEIIQRTEHNMSGK